MILAVILQQYPETCSKQMEKKLFLCIICTPNPLLTKVWLLKKLRKKPKQDFMVIRYPIYTLKSTSYILQQVISYHILASARPQKC